MNKFLTRIMIFGRSGSGKSTFALKLKKAVNLPLYHLDKYFYTSNWIERDYKEFLFIQQSMVNEDAWIIDGNAIKSLEMRYSKAELVLYFNYPRSICYWRMLQRLFCKDSEIDDRAENCKEIITWKLLCYMWNFNNRVKKQIIYLQEQYPAIKFMEIRSDKELLLIKDKLQKS